LRALPSETIDSGLSPPSGSRPYIFDEVNVLEHAGDILEMVLKHRINFVLMGRRHVTRVIGIDNTVLVNAGTTSSARTLGRFGYSFNLIGIFEDKAVQVTERNPTQRKTIPIVKYVGPCPT
jgi:predicted phosphodiesterase